MKNFMEVSTLNMVDCCIQSLREKNSVGTMSCLFPPMAWCIMRFSLSGQMCTTPCAEMVKYSSRNAFSSI